MRKHRIAERLLADIIGLEWEAVHEEACRWEHVMSDHVEEKILTLLGEPTESPYGNPIPGLEELGRTAAESFGAGVISLDRVTPKDGTVITGPVRRLGEPLQSDVETLALLREIGLLPGVTVSSSRPTGALTVHVEVNGQTVVLPQDVAIHIFIAS
jgi:DtxR family Mn-dependent transcriptional regulator